MAIGVGTAITAGITTAADSDSPRSTRASLARMGAENERDREMVAARPAVVIEYCRQSRWLLRAAWIAQEILSTFEEEVGGVTLVPGTGGVFVVSVSGEAVWSRKDEGRFPEIAELKQRVRDRVAPERELGHVDRPSGADRAGLVEIGGRGSTIHPCAAWAFHP